MKNKKLVITIVIVIAILILTIGLYFLLRKPASDVFTEQIKRDDIAIGNSDLSIEMSNELAIDISDVKLLRVSEQIQIEYIETLISKLNIGASLTSKVEGVTYQWCNDNESRCLVYDVIPDTLSFSFDEQPLALQYDISGVTNPKEAWEIFQSEFDLTDYSYTNETYQRDSQGFSLTANRSFDDIQIKDISNKEYSDVIGFNNKGFLVSGKLLLVDFLAIGDIPTVTVKTLIDVINDDIYPKQYIVDRSSLDFGVVQNNADIDLGYPEEIFDIGSCKATDIELVYVFRTRNASGYVIPAYKIGCSSEIEFEDALYTVAITVYANAISPEYILVE